jgi:hypothetical protein
MAYADTILALPNLRYYYRLGEAGPWPSGAAGSPALEVPDFALDSSPSGLNLTAWNIDDAGTVVYVATGDPALPECDVTGAPISGDDGAIRFNFNYAGSGVGDSQRLVLEGGGGYPIEIDMRSGTGPHPVGSASTFGAQLKFWEGVGDVVNPWLVSNWSRTFGVGNYGARVGFLPDGTLYYRVGSLNLVTDFQWTSDALDGGWHSFVTSIARLATSSYRRRIFVDSVKVFELVGTLTDIGSGAENHGSLTIGGGNAGDIAFAFASGFVDEVFYCESEVTFGGFHVWSRS